MSKLPESLTFEHIDPESIELLDWESMEPILESIHGLPTLDAKDVEQFLEYWNEFDSLVSERAHRLRARKARYTDDDEYTQKWKTFVGEIAPRLTKWNDRLGRKLVGAESLEAFEGTDYWPFIEQVRRDVELFEEDNVPLERDVMQLSTQYGEITGNWTVEYEGRERTFSEMAQWLESPDRSVRRDAWEAMAKRRMEDADELDELFDDMFDKRHQIALNAGFDNYRDYAFAEKMRDYDPEACFHLHELVEREVLPLAEEIADWKKQRLGLDTYRPWDGKADPTGQEGLEPFEDVEQLKSGVERMMRRLDTDLGGLFGNIRQNMDLESRPNKEQGGFQMFLPASRRPFIFANVTGRHSDVTTLVHEAGHAFHSILQLPRKPMSSTAVPMEFNEVASMSMELLNLRTLDEFYSDDEQQSRAIDEHLRRIPKLLLAVARGDAFQHWLYTHPEHTAEQRRQKWVEQLERFQPYVDRSEVPEAWTRTGWHRTLHFFKIPFYYIEYGFAQLGALQIALNAERDLEGALADYKSALRLGAVPDTEQLFAEAGADFVPSQSKVRRLMDWIRERLFESDSD